MPGRTCTVCVHASLAQLQIEMANGEPLSALAFRYDLAKSSLSRHAKNHMGRTPHGNARPKGTSRPPRISSRNALGPRSRSDSHDADAGRCRECGQITGENDTALAPETIVKRAERILHVSENIAMKAQDADDSRLALLAVDRCQRSIDTLARIAGLLKPDTTIIDARQVNVYASWPTHSLESLQTFHDVLASGATVEDAIGAVLTTPSLALPVQQNAPTLPSTVKTRGN
jgi:hypothetical protein